MNLKTTCLPKQTLVDFKLGMLEPNEVEVCESHLDHCVTCGETLRAIEAEDTLLGITDKLNQRSRLVSDDSDQEVVEYLIDKLEGLQPVNASIESKGSNEFGPGKLTQSNRAQPYEVISQLQSTDDPELLGRLAHFDIHEVLGVGATSVVFRATDQKLKRDVALKVLRPSLGHDARQRFLTEARAAAALVHDNIIQIFEVSAEDQLAYMAQQWLPGETLESKIRREPNLNLEEIKSIITQVANGLDAAHSKSLIHRDIKPANIWIESKNNRAIILDFGLVRVSDEDSQMTRTGMIAGTPNFMSPEQTRGQELDSRSDLFSLGCILYRLSTGKLPFQADNVLATLQSIQNDFPTPPRKLNPQISNEISDLTMMLLSKHRNDRPQTASEVVEALESKPAMSALLSTRTKGAGRYQQPTLSRWIWGSIAATVFALAAIVLSQPQIIRIMTNHGLLEIETDDPNVSVEVLQGAKVIHVIDQTTDQKLEIAAGTYKIRPTGEQNSFELSEDSVTMKRGGKVIVTVTKRSGTASELLSSLSTEEQALSDSITINLDLPRSQKHTQTVTILKSTKEQFEEKYSRLLAELSELRTQNSGRIAVDKSEMTIHEAKVVEIGKRLEEMKIRLSAYSADKKRAVDALESGDKQIEAYVWNLKQSGKIKEKGLSPNLILELEKQLNVISKRLGQDHPYAKGLNAEIEEFKKIANTISENISTKEVLERFLSAIEANIIDLNTAIAKDSQQYQFHYAKAKRNAEIRNEIEAVTKQLEQLKTSAFNTEWNDNG